MGNLSMIIKLNKSFAILILLILINLFISGCTSTKPTSEQDNFSPDSVSNSLVELSNGYIMEYYENGLYEIRNSIGELQEQGSFLYKKIDGTNAEIVYNNSYNPEMRVAFNFINPIIGYYKFTTPPYASGRFEILNRKKDTLDSFDQALKYVYSVGSKNIYLSPNLMPKGAYKFFIQTQEKPVKKGILFFITIKENGLYDFEQRHENPMAPHTSNYRYSKTNKQEAELILDGFDNEIFYLSFQNANTGTFTKKAATSDRIYEGIFLKE